MDFDSTKKPCVSFLTFAYNSEKYIEACAESVIRQTLKDVEWVVIDNGCTDGTYDILKKYAEKDQRIRVYRNKENSHKEGAVYEYEDYYAAISLVRGEYFATLDSDDIYEVSFAEEMYRAARKADADMAVCGNEFVEEVTGQSQGYRVPPCFSGSVEELCRRLPEFYGCLRPMWGKLYRLDTWMKHEVYLREHLSGMRNGADTYVNLKFLSVSHRVVGVNKSLHRYLVRNNSVYFSNIYADRYKSYDLIFLEGMSLLTYMDAASNENVAFLSIVHFNSMLDLLEIAAKSAAAPGEKIRYLIKSTLSPVFLMYMNQIPSGETKKYFQPMFQMIYELLCQLIQAGQMSKAFLTEVRTFLGYFQGGNQSDGLCKARNVLEEYQNKLEELKPMCDGASAEKNASLLMRKSEECPLRVVSDPEFYLTYSDICFMVLQEKYSEALETMSTVLLEEESISDRETFLQLYITVAAAIENESAFIYGKFQIAWLLLEKRQIDNCKEVIGELVEMGMAQHKELRLLKQKVEAEEVKRNEEK